MLFGIRKHWIGDSIIRANISNKFSRTIELITTTGANFETANIIELCGATETEVVNLVNRIIKVGKTVWQVQWVLIWFEAACETIFVERGQDSRNNSGKPVDVDLNFVQTPGKG
jgi:hypothetical protein